MLFSFYKSIGNKWKAIAKNFPGRTDNGIKNQFFSLIRKSLRNARKILGKVSNTALINKIKPKVLSDFFNQSINVIYPDDIVKTLGIQEEKVYFSEFVKIYAFNNFHDLYQRVSEKDIYIIQEAIDFLTSLNKNYIA